MQPNNKPRYTETKLGADAIEAVMVGVRGVAEPVASTLGVRGRNSLIEEPWGSITVLHDGVRTANAQVPEEPFERAGAKLLQEAGKKQRDACGDGTTAVSILSLAIVEEALKVTAAGVNPMSLRRELEYGSKKVVARLESLATPVTTLEQKEQIATISAEDESLGRLIAKTIHKIGDDGVLTVDESKAMETYVEHQEGMQVEKGYAHPFMVTDLEKQLALLEDCYVLVTDIPLHDMSQIGKFLESKIFPNTKRVLFISPEIGTDFLTPLLGAKIQGQFLGVAMRAPGIASIQIEILQDIAALTGATYITKEAGHKFDDFDFSALGHANRIIMSKISTIIEGGAGHKEHILERIAVIRKQLEDETISDWEREQLKGRLGKLTNGVAVIKVGGQTEVEMKERKERVLDAVASTQSAVKHGFVPGGEIVYLDALSVLDDKILGEKILKEALKQPFKRLVSNAGFDPGEMLALLKDTVIADYTKQGLGVEGFGIDVTTGEMVDLVKAGIIDSAAISQVAVKTAVSVGIQLITLGSATVYKNQL